jgi:hypothetical protein
MVQVLLIVVFVGIAALVAWHIHQAEQRRRRQAQAHAASLGYDVDLETKSPPRLDFELFDSGHSKKVTYHTWRDGSPDNVFQYQYTTGSGKNSTVHKRTAALVHVPFTAPHLEIGPEGFWSTFGRAIGIRDIEIESAEFNDRYRVRCDDERFAITLLDHDMIAWMLSPHSGGGYVKFEFGGRWMLCWGDRLEYQHLIPLLQWAQQARTNLPTVLTSLYPPS